MQLNKSFLKKKPNYPPNDLLLSKISPVDIPNTKIAFGEFRILLENLNTLIHTINSSSSIPITNNSYLHTSINRDLKSPYSQHDLIKNFDTPIFISKNYNKDLPISCWIQVCDEFCSKDTPLQLTPEDWIEDALTNFYNGLSVLDQYCSYSLSDYCYDEIFDKTISDTPFIFVYNEPLFEASEKERFADEINFLLDFIINEGNNTEIDSRTIAWIKEYKFDLILESDFPAAFKDIKEEMALYLRNCKDNCSNVDLESYNLLEIRSTYTSVDPISIDIKEQALAELENYYKLTSIISTSFYSFLEEPAGEVFPVTSFWNECEISIKNNFTKEVISGNDLEDHEHIFWQIFFSHYYPDVIRTNWTVIKK